ncbi:major facilitator superfamily transporter [Botrytis cinerea]
MENSASDTDPIPRISEKVCFDANLELMLAIFLPQVEGTIAATALISITNDLRGFNESSWIITAYMLTYTCFLIISAKLSDIFGRKSLLLVSVGLFVIFSAACAGAQSMTQLIILRAFQGIGASGTYALVTVILFELVPSEKYASYTSILAAILGASLVIGPILGGIICNFTTWRWIFIINVILGAITISMYKPKTLSESFSRQQFGRVDFIGTGLLLCAAILLIVALEETGIDYKWNSGFIIAVLTISIISWISFFAWSWRITSWDGTREPIFPWRFLTSRTCAGLFIIVFLTGMPLTVALVQLLLRFQVVNGLSQLNAGVRLLPFLAFTPAGSMVTAGVEGKFKVPPLYMFIAASCLQIAAFTLLSFSPTDSHINHAQYGYQAMAAIAIGSSLTSLTVMAPFMVEERDKSVAMAAVLQFRTMGGAIGLAIVTTVMNRYIKTHLSEILTPNQVHEILRSTESLALLPPSALRPVTETFARGFNLQMRILIGTSVAQIPFSMLVWRKKQIVV